MSSRKKLKVEESKDKITVRLDERTVITLKSMDAFDFWKEKYPNAKVIAA